MKTLVFLAIFLGSQSGLYADVFLPHLSAEEQINRLEVADDKLWIIGSRNLYRLTDAEQTAEPVKGIARATSVTKFGKDIFIGTVSGLFRLGRKETIAVLPGESITSLEVFEEHLWVGTQRGLFVLGQNRPLHRLQVLDLKVIEGDLWIASVQGAFTIAGPDPRRDGAKPVLKRPLESVDFAEKTPVPVKGIERLDNQIWLATLRNLQLDWPGNPYLVVNGKTYSPLGTHDWQVSSMTSIGDELFFATREGLGKIANGKAELLSTEHPVKLAFKWGDRLGLCTTRELLRGSLGDSVFRRSTAGGSLSCNDSEVFQKKLWIAAEQGLFRYYPKVRLDLDSGSFFGWNIVVQGDELKALQPFYEGLPTNSPAKVSEQTISSDLSGVAYPFPLGRSTVDVLLLDPYGNTRSKSIRLFRLPSPSPFLLLTTGVTILIFVVLFRAKQR